MVYYTEKHRTPDSLYDWAREKGIRLSAIIFSAVITPNLINYIQCNGNWVTHVTYRESKSKDVQFHSSISQYLPNVHSLHIDTGLTLRYTQTESKRLLQKFQVLPVSVLTIFMASPSRTFCEFDLSFLLQTFPLLEKLNAGPNVTMSTSDTDAVHPNVEYIYNINFRYSRHFPNLENIYINQDPFGFMVPAAGNKYNQLHYTISSDDGLQILHQLLNVMPGLSQLQLTCIETIRVKSVATDLNCRYTNLLSLDIRMSRISHMTDLQFLLLCCPNLSTIEVSDCHSSCILHLCKSALECCKNLSSLIVYAWDDKAIQDSISNLLNCCLQHQYIRTLGFLSTSLVVVEFYPYATTQYLCARVRSVIEIDHIDPLLCSTLQKCTTLFHVELANFKGDLDIHMLYEACPTIKSISYGNGESYRLFQYSHSQLDCITIHNFQDNGLFDDSRPTAQFPSLRSMSISGSIDCDSWKRMLAKCEFRVHRLTVRDKDSLSAITDTLLHHRNFRELQYVFVEKMNSHQLEEFSAKTGRRIQFHNSCWLQQKW